MVLATKPWVVVVGVPERGRWMRETFAQTSHILSFKEISFHFEVVVKSLLNPVAHDDAA